MNPDELQRIQGIEDRLIQTEAFVRDFDPRAFLNDIDPRFGLEGNNFKAPGVLNKIAEAKHTENTPDSLHLENLPGSDNMLAVIHIIGDGFIWGSGSGTSVRPVLQFNKDTTTGNYAVQGYYNSSSGWTNGGENGIALKNAGASTGDFYILCYIKNIGSKIKQIRFAGTQLGSGGPNTIEGGAAWNNTDELIETISLVIDTGTFGIGTTLTIYTE